MNQSISYLGAQNFSIKTDFIIGMKEKKGKWCFPKYFK